MSMNIRIHLHYILLAALMICAGTAIMACGRSDDGGDKDSPDGRVQVAVSYDAHRMLLESIGGERVEATSILPAGADPETYEPSVSSLKKLRGSRLYLTTSTPGYEENIAQKIKSAFPDIQIVDLSQGIRKITGTHSLHDEHGHCADITDPHLLSSVRNAKIISDNILNILISTDSAGRVYYTTRHKALNARLDSIDRALAASVIGKAFVVMHPSLSYFARDYGMTQISLGSAGKESSPAALKKALSQAKSLHPTLMVVEQGTVTPQTKAVADFLGIPIVQFGQNGYGWAEDIQALGKAFEQK